MAKKPEVYIALTPQQAGKILKKIKEEGKKAHEGVQMILFKAPRIT